VNGEGDTFELAVPKDKGPVNQIVLMEQIKHGERVRKFSLEAKVAGEWKKVYSGSCIGHKHIVRFADVAAEKIKLTITSSAATPLIRDFSAYRN
jgi:alpha-L-fucosidase